MSESSIKKIAIVGGGAAGFFTAIMIGEKAQELELPIKISIFESSGQYLKKVRISGGGRCNVTHNLFEVRSFTENYPRGSRELLSPMQRFQAKDTVEWFKKAGIKLVAEEDGRMFPETNSSQTIIDCYLEKTKELGVELINKSPVKAIRPIESNQLALAFKKCQYFNSRFCHDRHRELPRRLSFSRNP